MKQILLIILLLFFSCTTSKQKSRQKNEEQTEQQIKTSGETQRSGTVNVASTKNSLSESSVQSDFAKNQLITNQNFTLKQNGKCADPGTVRNVQFTDKAGNTTTIQVNDNTELNFGNQSEESKEIATLKEDKKTLESEKTDLQSKYDESKKELSQTKSKLKKLQLESDIQKKKSNFWQFALCVVLTLVAWGGGRKLIKTYIL